MARGAVAQETLPKATPRHRIASILCNIVLAGFFSLFVIAQLINTEPWDWLRSFPIVMQVSTMVVLFLTRRPSVATTSNRVEWLVAVAGTLSPMLAAGEPLVEAQESVAGAAGNYEYYVATKKIQSEVATGSSLMSSMQGTEVFPNMVLQMVSIGEESGSLDAMLGKVADFYEAEVDDAVAALSSLMEPMIMVVLGTLIGGLVIAMYLPIFKMGQAV